MEMLNFISLLNFVTMEQALISPRRKETTTRFYNSVRNEYGKLVSIKERGVPVYTQDYILMKLADRFFRSPKTIENIIFNRV